MSHVRITAVGSLIKIFLWVLPPVFLGAGIALFLWFKRDIYEREKRVDANVGELRAAPVEEFDFGLEKFDEAVAALRDEGDAAGRAALAAMLRSHRDSARASDAMNLLGQMNLDRLLSEDPMERKKRVAVRPGDSINRIAQREETTFHYIMRANGLTRPEGIQPGDQLWVAPMNYRAVARLGEKRLILMDGDYFFAVFPLTAATRPPGTRLPAKGAVSNKFAIVNGRRVLTTSPGYDRAEKIIEIGREWTIRSHPDDQPPPAGYGLFLRNSDMEDLMAVLRAGNTVEINP